MKNNIKKHVGQQIKHYRKIQKITQKELGEKVGVKHNTISSYENGLNEPEQDILYNLANVLNVSVNDFFPSKDEGNEVIDFIKTNEYIYVPTAISAGIPINIDCISENEVQKIKIPDMIMGRYARSKDIYITKISGDSMDRVIPDESFIAIKKISSVQELQDGDIVMFSDEYEYSVKRFFKNEDRIIFRPDSNNSTHFDHITTKSNSNLIIHGKVVWYVVEI